MKTPAPFVIRLIAVELVLIAGVYAALACVAYNFGIVGLGAFTTIITIAALLLVVYLINKNTRKNEQEENPQVIALVENKL